MTAVAAFRSSVAPLSKSQKAQLKKRGFWQRGCPVGLGDLRVLSVQHFGWDRKPRRGELVVNARVAHQLRHVFRRLYDLRFPIRHLSFADAYGPRRERPRDGDVSGSFECRQAVPSPCSGGSGTGTWSNHAFGLPIDLNPRENPYVGCGQSYDPDAIRFRDRRPHRKGMVGRHVVRAFASIGWGWGGAWAGRTKDYIHFSHNGR